MVIGYIEYFIKQTHAKIKVLAFKKGNIWVKDPDEIREYFQPEGNVFEPGFKLNNEMYNTDDIIVFEVIDNPQANNPGEDSYKLKGKVKYKLEYEVILAPNFLNDDFSINYNYIQKNFEDLPNSFYLKNLKGYYGLFVKDNNFIRPHKGTTVNYYPNLDDNIISYKDKTVLFANPEISNIQIDFSSDEQLIGWFKKTLKSSNLLDEKSFNNVFNSINIQSIDDDNISRSKLNRIQNLFSKIHFTFSELKDVVNLVPDIKTDLGKRILSIRNEILIDCKSEIEADLNEFKLKANAEKELIENKIQALKKKLESKSERLVKIAKELNQSLSTLVDYLNSNGIKLENKPTTPVDLENQLLLYKKFGNAQNGDIKVAKEELEKIKAEIEIAKNDFDVLNSKINHLTENRDTVIRDMQLFLDITRPTPVIAQANQIPKSYIIEEILPQQSGYLSDVDFAHNFIHNLQKRNKAADIKFPELMKIISSFKCIFTSNLEVILAFIEATNNAIYTIIQIEPKWLSFKDLVDNGLSELWLSAFEKPDVLHFVILRDINLSSPECYANPLLDLDRNLRTKLPLIEKPWPPNLRIIGTIQPVPEVGLSVLKSTFDNWGGLPTYGLQFTSVNPSEYKGQALQVTNFNTWICDRDDINNYLDQYIS